ncbi:hypothetical protein C2G38_1141169 [Gigaspora rosea]|uniref:Uncharacterized protein n=1 Tax=Gigaspora rosea TaxID=44941 RepID=A0A397TRL4_9GLOM|nr:hypothetical protein C2G38_1141169 [Gigaspora rosea]
MQKVIYKLVKGLKLQYKAIPIGNEASRSLYVSSYLVAASNLLKNRFTISPEKTISGPNRHGTLDYALVTSTSFNVFGAVEVKATDYLQDIAQNTVQCESILTNRRKPVFKIITDSEKWGFLKCFSDDNGNPIFQLSKQLVLFMEMTIWKIGQGKLLKHLYS